ncbi:hypothetical protein Hypma_012313 [Hypsizygus marmoreus]|uniref:Uncharacterized protein n=1 Tax=Hypsizygus marmoreus TaxID=39966 RepID=A0A369JHQ0_HYPMA|nr:hypothetical protein Hypma_012313 [Hypsizygus marmoreus]
MPTMLRGAKWSAHLPCHRPASSKTPSRCAPPMGMAHVIMLRHTNTSMPPNASQPQPSARVPIPIWGLVLPAPHFALSIFQCSALGSLEDGSVLLAASAAPLYMVGPALHLLTFRSTLRTY